jgi:hypothetical protein
MIFLVHLYTIPGIVECKKYNILFDFYLIV